MSQGTLPGQIMEQPDLGRIQARLAELRPLLEQLRGYQETLDAGGMISPQAQNLLAQRDQLQGEFRQLLQMSRNAAQSVPVDAASMQARIAELRQLLERAQGYQQTLDAGGMLSQAQQDLLAQREPMQAEFRQLLQAQRDLAQQGAAVAAAGAQAAQPYAQQAAAGAQNGAQYAGQQAQAGAVAAQPYAQQAAAEAQRGSQYAATQAQAGAAAAQPYAQQAAAGAQGMAAQAQPYAAQGAQMAGAAGNAVAPWAGSMAVAGVTYAQAGGQQVAQAVGDFDMFKDAKAPEAWASDLHEAYTHHADSIQDAMSGLAGVIENVFDFAKFDILRDYVQIIGLFFSGFVWPHYFSIIWGTITNVTAIDFDSLFNNLSDRLGITGAQKFIVQGIFILIFLVAIISTARFGQLRRRATPDAQNDGLETTTWAELDPATRKSMKIVMTILTTLYLPITNNSLKILLCAGTWRTQYTCYQGGHLGYCAGSIVMIGCITVYLPYKCYKLIQENKPTEILFDEEGKPKDFTDEDYAAALKADKCPYNFLYNGYERKWAYYKVVMMVIKVFLILPIVVLGENFALGNPQSAPVKYGQPLVVILVLAIYAVITFRASPFLKFSNDLLDRGARIVTLITAILGFVYGLMSPAPPAVINPIIANAFAIVLNVVQLMNFIFMTVVSIASKDTIINKWRRCRKKVGFTKDRKGKTERIFSDDLDLKSERRIRIWHPFWDGLLLTHPSTKVPEMAKDQSLSFISPGPPGTAPYLKNFKGTIGERHMENKQIVSAIGAESYTRALADPGPAVSGAQTYVMNNHVGVDAYWNDGQNSSQVCFGKMFIIPFPFTLIFQYDDTLGLTMIRTDRVAEFADQNSSQDVQRRRYMRHQIRALDNTQIYMPFQRVIQKTKTREKKVSDGQGGTRTEIEHYTVDVNFSFTNGTMDLDSAKEKNQFVCADGASIPIAAGFNVALRYSDGEGVDHEGTAWRGECVSLAGEEIGVTKDFNASHPNFQRVLQGGQHWQNNFNTVKAHYQEYRDSYSKEMTFKRQVLTYAFWYNVYNNDDLSQEQLASVVNSTEPNPTMRGIMQDPQHAAGFKYLYAKVNHFKTHPGVAFWFCYWDDVWLNNKENKDFKEKSALLSAISPTSLCYRPMNRSELCGILETNGLRTSAGKGYFSDAQLNRLYDGMDRVKRRAMAV